MFPQYEDAGIVPLEAQACGTPVIAYRAGGAMDVVKENETGLFFDAQTTEAIKETLNRFKEHSWDRSLITNHAKTFSETVFKKRLSEEVTKAYELFKQGNFIFSI